MSNDKVAATFHGDPAVRWVTDFVDSDPLVERMVGYLLPALRGKLRENSVVGEALRKQLGAVWLENPKSPRSGNVIIQGGKPTVVSDDGAPEIAAALRAAALELALHGERSAVKRLSARADAIEAGIEVQP